MRELDDMMFTAAYWLVGIIMGIVPVLLILWSK
jgi:hypothetical protein